MARISFMLSRAVEKGRRDGGVPRNREEILVGLLHKRAEAYRRGLAAHERLLRDQISWALPVRD